MSGSMGQDLAVFVVLGQGFNPQSQQKVWLNYEPTALISLQEIEDQLLPWHHSTHSS